MDCKKIKDELVFLCFEGELGTEITIAFRRHVSVCPECDRKARFTAQLMELVRERQRACRCQAPITLRTRILASLPHRQQ